jgi:hypothetical protein
MNADTSEHPVRTKVSRLPWRVFIAGLTVWPLIFAAEWSYKHGILHSRTSVDYFAYTAVGVGFLCCILAPFLGGTSLKKKILLSLLAFLSFAVLCYASFFTFLALFGLPKE